MGNAALDMLSLICHMAQSQTILPDSNATVRQQALHAALTLWRLQMKSFIT